MVLAEMRQERCGCLVQGCGSGSGGSGSAKNLPLQLPHKLFDLKSNLAKKFCPFPDVDLTVKLHYKSE